MDEEGGKLGSVSLRRLELREWLCFSDDRTVRRDGESRFEWVWSVACWGVLRNAGGWDRGVELVASLARVGCLALLGWCLPRRRLLDFPFLLLSSVVLAADLLQLDIHLWRWRCGLVREKMLIRWYCS